MIRNKFTLAVIAAAVLGPVLYVGLLYGDIQQIQAAGYSTIKQGSTTYTARTVLNFLTNMTCADNSTTSPPETDCTPSGGGGSSYYQTVEQSGSALTQQPTLNFTGAGVTCVNNSGSTRTDCTIPGAGTGYTPFANFTALANSGWSWFNQGSSTVAFSGGIAVLSVPSTEGINVVGYTKTLPAAPWTAILAIVAAPAVIPQNVVQSGGWQTGFMLTDGTKLKLFGPTRVQNGTGSNLIELLELTNSSTFSSASISEGAQLMPPVLWFKVHDDGTTLHYYTSIDPTNVGWGTQVYSEGDTVFLTATAVGFFIDAFNSTAAGSQIFTGDANVSWALTTP